MKVFSCPPAKTPSGELWGHESCKVILIKVPFLIYFSLLNINKQSPITGNLIVFEKAPTTTIISGK